MYKNTKVVVAMSGGVDSSVVAGILKEEGYDVIGITLQLYNSSQEIKTKTCCSGIDIYDAKEVARKLEIPHYVLNYQEKFKKAVIDDFIDSYKKNASGNFCGKFESFGLSTLESIDIDTPSDFADARVFAKDIRSEIVDNKDKYFLDIVNIK